MGKCEPGSTGTIASAFLQKGAFPGFEIYVTGTDIIGVKRTRVLLAANALLLAIVVFLGIFAFLFSQGLFPLIAVLILLPVVIPFISPSFLANIWIRNRTPLRAEQARARNDFRFEMGQIREIELRKPQGWQSRIGLGDGHVMIVPNGPAEETVKISVLRRSESETLERLLLSNGGLRASIVRVV